MRDRSQGRRRKRSVSKEDTKAQQRSKKNV